MSDLSDYKRMVSEPYARHMQAVVAKLNAENARLAGQVAAIRALCDAADPTETDYRDGGLLATDAIRAALVASSPTTPEAS